MLFLSVNQQLHKRNTLGKFWKLGEKILDNFKWAFASKRKKKLFHWKPIMISQDMRREGIFLDFITYENV